MLLQKERELVVEYGKKMSSSGLSKGTSGNISIYNRKEQPRQAPVCQMCGKEHMELSLYLLRRSHNGTPELAEAAIEACGKGKAVLLANHGLLTCGPNIGKAFGLAVNMEFCAEMQFRAMCVGDPVILSDSEMENVMERFQSYGQPKKDGESKEPNCY